MIRTVLLTALTAPLLAACGNSAEVRYRVSVEVKEGNTHRSGSSVWSWKLNEPSAALATPYSGRFRGEAVAVPLSGGRTLYALLRDWDGNEGMPMLIPERLFGDLGRGIRGEKTKFRSDRVADLRDIASRVGERQVLDCAGGAEECPLLVIFERAGDPSSAKRIDPATPASMPPDISSASVVVEITDDPVTTGIGRELPWLPQTIGAAVRQGPQTWTRETDPGKFGLIAGDFRRGTE